MGPRPTIWGEARSRKSGTAILGIENEINRNFWAPIFKYSCVRGATGKNRRGRLV